MSAFRYPALAYKSVGTNGWSSNRPSGMAMVPFWRRLLLEPAATIDTDFSGMKAVRKIVSSALFEFIGSFLYAVLIPIAAFSLSGTNQGLNGILLGLVHGAFLFACMNWRFSPFLPRHFNWTFTASDIVHGDLGILFGVGYMVVQLLGALLAWPVLTGLGVVGSRAYDSADGSFGALAAPSIAGLVFIVLLVNFVIAFVRLHNHRLGQFEVSGGGGALTFQTVITAFTVMAGVALQYQFGLISISPVTYFAAALANNSFNLPFAGAWAIFIFVSMGAGILAAIIHLFTWNTAYDSADVTSGQKTMDRTPITPETNGDVAAVATAFGRSAQTKYW